MRSTRRACVWSSSSSLLRWRLSWPLLLPVLSSSPSSSSSCAAQTPRRDMTSHAGAAGAWHATRPCLRAGGSMHVSDLSTPDQATITSTSRKELKTALCNELIHKALAQGYYTLSQYVKDCLTHPQYGYYSTKQHVIGRDHADFLTAAEIPFFGDVLAAWIIDVWQKMGTPRVLHLVELGPGKGTLMQTILRQVRYAMPQLLHFLRVHLVEIGAARQAEQRTTLAEFQTAHGRLRWYMAVDALSLAGEPVVFVANEFFDALPVAQFCRTERGWVETCIEVDDDAAHEAHFRRVHAPSGSVSAYLIPDDVRATAPLGTFVEVNVAGMEQLETVMRKMVESTLAVCVIVDYGKDEHMHNTLRGIRGHRFVDPLLSPGEVDLSSWVSFRQLRWVLERLELARQHLKWFPVITQREFLQENGIDVRLAHAIKSEETKSAMRILQNYQRLMSADEMGTSYKVFVVQSRNLPNVAPFFDAMPLPTTPARG